MHIFGQSEKGPCTSLSTWPKYLNVLIYANWGGLMVKTNFDSEEEVPLKLRKPCWMVGAAGDVECIFWTGELGRPNCIAWIGPRQWIVLSQPAVLRPTKARQAQRKCATAAHSLRRYPHHPTTPPYSKPLCAAWGAALLCLVAWRQQPSEEALRGAKGAKGGRWTGGRGQATRGWSAPTMYTIWYFSWGFQLPNQQNNGIWPHIITCETVGNILPENSSISQYILSRGLVFKTF